MNISHNYSRLESVGPDTESVIKSDVRGESASKCLDEQELRKLIDVPCSMFFANQDYKK